MAKEGGAVYVVFIGNICAGKDTIIEHIKKSGRLENIIDKTKGEAVHYPKEAVNHDPEVLKAYYTDMAGNTDYFECASLGARIILANGIRNLQGIVVGNRYTLEGRETFVKVNSRRREDGREPHMTPVGVATYDLMLNSAIQRGLPMPNLAIFLDVNNPEILYSRIQKRMQESGIDAEKGIPKEYLSELTAAYTRFNKNFALAHTERNLKPPRLITINASEDINQDNRFLERVAELSEAEILQTYREKNPTLHNFIKK